MSAGDHLHRPYITDAERDLEPLRKMCDQVHDLVVATARRVADNEGTSGRLLNALRDLSRAGSLLERALDDLTEEGAWDLWSRAQDVEPTR